MSLPPPRTDAAGQDNGNGAVNARPAAGSVQRFWRRVHHPAFRQGARDMAGVSLGIGAWGLVTGVAMVKSGMDAWLAALMSITVFSGTAQLAALPLIASGAPIWVVWATTVCLNLRFVIFSVQWRPYLAHLPLNRRALTAYFCADLNYVLFMRRFPGNRPGPKQRPYFWGGVLAYAGAWHVMSLLGIVLAQVVPTHWGLGFAGTLALLGVTYSLLTDRRTWLPAAVAASASVATYGLPFRLNLVVAIATAVVLGLLVNREKPSAPTAVAPAQTPPPA